MIERWFGEGELNVLSNQQRRVLVIKKKTLLRMYIFDYFYVLYCFLFDFEYLNCFWLCFWCC